LGIEGRIAALQGEGRGDAQDLNRRGDAPD